MWEEDLDNDVGVDDCAGLAVRGRACYLFRDDALARVVDEGELLVAYAAQDLLLDRCDARAVLIAHNAFDAVYWDDLRCRERVSEEEEDVDEGGDGEDEETLRELRRERFADLPTETHTHTDESETVSERETHTQAQAHTPAHTLTEAHTQSPTHTHTEAVSRSLLPSLPADKAMPATLREWRVLLHTAKAVREKGAPFEIVLRTQVDRDRDRDTHGLSFLEPTSPLYDCYKQVLSLDDEAFWRLLLGREEEQRLCALSALQEYEKDDGEHQEDESNNNNDGDPAITITSEKGKEKDAETEEEVKRQKQSRKRKRTQFTDKAANNNNNDRSRNDINSSNNNSNNNNEDIADEDGLDEDCDAHRPWGRENFLSARLRREKEAEREREKKAARLRAARMLRGHFLLHSDPHNKTHEHEHETTATTGVHEQKAREPLEGKDVQQKIRSALKILSPGVEW